ncbi:MAG: hypothetical protein LUI06_02980 [Ruminococcus sp.]|nr:hypothetical protein [Ruminococcus sp.]
MKFKEMNPKEKARRIVGICILTVIVVFLLINIAWLVFLQSVCSKNAEALGFSDFNAFSYLCNMDDDIYNVSLKDEENEVSFHAYFPNYLEFSCVLDCTAFSNGENSDEGLEVTVSWFASKKITATCSELVFEGMTDRGYETEYDTHEFKVDSNLELSDDYSSEEIELFNASLDKFKEQKQPMIEVWGEDIF